MTGGQVGLSLHEDSDADGTGQETIQRLPSSRKKLKVVLASAEEIAAHELRLNAIDKASGSSCIWRQEKLASLL